MSDSPQRPVNIWRARHAATGEIHFVVGSYNESTGQYRREYNARERRAMQAGFVTGKQGSFERVTAHTRESAARTAARDLYGYSRIADAYGNLGKAYERIS